MEDPEVAGAHVSRVHARSTACCGTGVAAGAGYFFSLMLTPAPARANFTPCVVAVKPISTPFWFLSVATAAPPPTVPPAPAAVYVPSKSWTFARLCTSPRALTLETPRSTTLRPSTVNGYFLPLYSRTPSPQLTPTPSAMDLVSRVTFPLEASCAELADSATTRHTRQRPTTVTSAVALC